MDWEWVKFRRPFSIGSEEGAILAPEAVTAIKSRMHSCSWDRSEGVRRSGLAEEIHDAKIEVTGGMSSAWAVVPFVFGESVVCSGRAFVEACPSACFAGMDVSFLMKPLTLTDFRIRSTSELTFVSVKDSWLGAESIAMVAEVFKGF